MNALFVIVLLAQATQPSDPTMDWLLDQSTPATQPQTAPTTQPVPPFAERKAEGERAGTILRSDGKQTEGRLATTPGKPIRVWESGQKRYVDLPWESIASIEAKILWERDEPEWRFKESGHDEKVFTGKTYPAREMEYTFQLVNGDIITGGAVAPVYVRVGEKTTQYVLHKRDKGPPGQTLGELVYVKRIVFQDAGDVR
jgi:hypothetical protein